MQQRPADPPAWGILKTVVKPPRLLRPAARSLLAPRFPDARSSQEEASCQQPAEGSSPQLSGSPHDVALVRQWPAALVRRPPGCSDVQADAGTVLDRGRRRARDDDGGHRRGAGPADDAAARRAPGADQARQARAAGLRHGQDRFHGLRLGQADRGDRPLAAAGPASCRRGAQGPRAHRPGCLLRDRVLTAGSQSRRKADESSAHQRHGVAGSLPMTREGSAAGISVHDVRRALSELGKLRFGEMRVEDAMHQIVQTTHTIFAVDGAGLMLADAEHNLRNAAVSDDRMRYLEELQIRHQEGPCITAFEDKELVSAHDLTLDLRWPAFSAAAVAQRVRAVLASPIPYNQDAVGVVAVMSEDSHPWAPEAELALLAFTDLAALLIASMLLGEQQTELAGQLQAALNSRAVIEQAKVVLIGRHGITARAAYEQLRARARSQRRKLAGVAAEIVRGAVRDG